MMTKRLKNGALFALLGLLAALLFFPMALKGNQPRVPAVTQVGKANPAFIRQLAPHAKRLGKAYGIRPSLLLAQASLETNYGRTLLGAKYKNLFGLPLGDGPGITVLVAAEKDKPETRVYQVYPSWEASLADYLARVKAGELGEKSLYADLVHAQSLDKAAQALVAGGFRKDKAYDDQLLAIIKEAKLEQYDKD